MATAEPVTEPIESLYSGLQYTDTAYVAAILAVLVPVSVCSLYAAFAGNAPKVRYLVVTIYAAACMFFYTTAWLCNMDVDASIGLPVAMYLLLLMDKKVPIVARFCSYQLVWGPSTRSSLRGP